MAEIFQACVIDDQQEHVEVEVGRKKPLRCCSEAGKLF